MKEFRYLGYSVPELRATQLPRWQKLLDDFSPQKKKGYSVIVKSVIGQTLFKLAPFLRMVSYKREPNKTESFSRFRSISSKKLTSNEVIKKSQISLDRFCDIKTKEEIKNEILEIGRNVYFCGPINVLLGHSRLFLVQQFHGTVRWSE